MTSVAPLWAPTCSASASLGTSGPYSPFVRPTVAVPAGPVGTGPVGAAGSETWGWSGTWTGTGPGADDTTCAARTVRYTVAATPRTRNTTESARPTVANPRPG